MSKVWGAPVVVDQGQFAKVCLKGERVARAHWQDDDRSLHADIQSHLVKSLYLLQVLIFDGIHLALISDRLPNHPACPLVSLHGLLVDELLHVGERVDEKKEVIDELH